MLYLLWIVVQFRNLQIFFMQLYIFYQKDPEKNKQLFTPYLLFQSPIIQSHKKGARTGKFFNPLSANPTK